MRSQPLPPECVGQDLQGSFSDHLVGVSRTQSRTHGSFQSAEKAFHRPASTKSGLLEGLWFHRRAPFSSDFAVGSPLNRWNDTLHTPTFSAFHMNPLRVISRVGKQSLGLCHGSGLAQQLRSMGTVVRRVEIDDQRNGHQASTDDHRRYFHPAAKTPPLSATKVITDCGPSQTRGVHRHFTASTFLLGRTLSNHGYQLLRNGQYVAAGTELLQRGKMRQLLPKPQALPQRGTGPEHIQNSS